jgi:hypothetical protein
MKNALVLYFLKADESSQFVSVQYARSAQSILNAIHYYTNL